LDTTGLVDKIFTAASAIDFGRKGFATRGKAEEGRLSYERCISVALSTFRDALNLRFASTTDHQVINYLTYTLPKKEVRLEALKKVVQKVKLK